MSVDLETEESRAGLKINTDKTMIFSLTGHPTFPIYMNGHSTGGIHIGSVVSTAGDIDPDVTGCSNNARLAFPVTPYRLHIHTRFRQNMSKLVQVNRE